MPTAKSTATFEIFSKSVTIAPNPFSTSSTIFSSSNDVKSGKPIQTLGLQLKTLQLASLATSKGIAPFSPTIITSGTPDLIKSTKSDCTQQILTFPPLSLHISKA